MNFDEAVRRTPKIVDCLKKGLQALGTHSTKIKVHRTRELIGSVDIDTCLKMRYPNAPRWDYAFGYKNHVYYVEVHQGKTSEVENIIRKFKWLEQWRARSATNLENLKDQSSHHWISVSGTASIRKGSSYQRKLDQNGILGPDSVLNADAVP